MHLNKKVYILISIVFILSSVISWLLPMNDVFKGIAAMPAVAALIGALYQLLRDQAQHEKQLELQRRNEFFNLAVTSHMANITFDKHVEFCEKYLYEVHETLRNIIMKGPGQVMIVHANNLSILRMEYSTWLTLDVALQLEEFEDAVSKLAEPPANDWERARKILGKWCEKSEKEDKKIAIESIKEKLRGILGIEELTQLRKWVITKAINSTDNDHE